MVRVTLNIDTTKNDPLNVQEGINGFGYDGTIDVLKLNQNITEIAFNISDDRLKDLLGY